MLRTQDSNSLLGSNCIWTVRFHVHNNPLNDSLLSGEIRKPGKKNCAATLVDVDRNYTCRWRKKNSCRTRLAVIESQSQKFFFACTCIDSPPPSEMIQISIHIVDATMHRTRTRQEIRKKTSFNFVCWNARRDGMVASPSHIPLSLWTLSDPVMHLFYLYETRMPHAWHGETRKDLSTGKWIGSERIRGKNTPKTFSSSSKEGIWCRPAKPGSVWRSWYFVLLTVAHS